jgi:hypothetical protein
MLKGTKLEELQDVLVIWIEQGYTKNKTATDEVSKDQVNVLG